MKEKLPEMKAAIIRRLWLGEDMASDVLVREIAGEEGSEAERAVLVTEAERLREELSRRQLRNEPFQFQAFEACRDLDACLSRIRCRVGELRRLMPIFEQRGTEIGNAKAEVLKNFQRMVALLDRAGAGKLPADFAEWEAKLDAIDESLEEAVNRAAGAVRSRAH